MAITPSPNPPSKAPFAVKTFAADPSSSSQNWSGGKYAKAKDSEGNDAKGKDSKGEDSKGEDDKGKDDNGKGGNGKREPEGEEEEEAATNIHYTAQSEREQRWEPTNRINERQYGGFRISWGEWMWIDGAWRETRRTTEDEVENRRGDANPRLRRALRNDVWRSAGEEPQIFGVSDR